MAAGPGFAEPINPYSEFAFDLRTQWNQDNPSQMPLQASAFSGYLPGPSMFSPVGPVSILPFCIRGFSHIAVFIREF